ncbi:histidine utilization repressor [Niveibacterium sp. 24ML]|uniref:histidine utilization repressor n=1 Tax=Niveibacterium sp. 24ML TaxID=2985512 RepID=UPI002271291D|nr:histidine utilization repressor [Niveibacterium sp. 24ML]MCX9158317.1 histidine utilization repressor [Niveibacterium sp. 24ML]
MTQAPKSPRYQQIKEDLLTRIRGGEWGVGEAIPPEEGLARDFGVARMTVNRALRELTDAGVLTRTRGAGTFVAPPRVEAPLLEIRNIAEDIAARGHAHTAALRSLAPGQADGALAEAFELPLGAPLFHSVLVHCEDGRPIQVEDRWVNAALAPDYLQLDFAAETPNAYLSRVAPLASARFTVEARLAPRDIAAMLGIAARAPCLVMHRVTRGTAGVASVATLWHPGEHYRLHAVIDVKSGAGRR